MTISCFIKGVLREDSVKFVAAETGTLIDKCRPSRTERRSRSKRCYSSAKLVFATLIALLPKPLHATTLSHVDVLKIGKKIWQNECNGTIAGLTSWNAGEDFASLGIGHFIWYPKGRRGPFEESFPKLVSFISKRGAKLPALLLGTGEKPCPWNSRTEFLRAQHSTAMNQLRSFLVDTIDLQAEFLIARLESALPKMVAEAAPSDRANVQEQFERLTKTSQGCYALVDYTSDAGAVDEFTRAARAVLTQRVQNSPADRHESRWLSGWIRRVNSYNGS